MDKLTIFVADESRLTIAGEIRDFMKERVEVVEITDAKKVESRILQSVPDIVILDMQWEINGRTEIFHGIKIIENIHNELRLQHRSWSKFTKFVILTNDVDIEHKEKLFWAMTAGAHGYCIKGVDDEAMLVRSLQEIHQGRYFFSPGTFILIGTILSTIVTTKTYVPPQGLDRETSIAALTKVNQLGAVDLWTLYYLGLQYTADEAEADARKRFGEEGRTKDKHEKAVETLRNRLGFDTVKDLRKFLSQPADWLKNRIQGIGIHTPDL